MPTVVYEEDYEWDEQKAVYNEEKHGFTFPAAVQVFLQEPLIIGDADTATERRSLALGLVEGIEVAVVYTIRGNRKRIISARRARKYEREALQRRLEEIDDKGSVGEISQSH